MYEVASPRALLHRLQHGLSKHPLELVYTQHKRWPIPQEPSPRDHLKLLVLDASFNPPTLAHLALANSLPPSLHPGASADGTSAQIDDTPDYDAKLLLLSVRNADKTLRRGDASYLQRLDMMRLFAQGIRHKVGTSHSEGHANVAIGITDEPTFVGKSSVLQAFFRTRFTEILEHPACNVQLNFVLGFDTLERLIQPRYYGSREQMLTSFHKLLSPAPDGDDSRIICAQRSSSSYTKQASSESDEISILKEWFSSQRIVIIDVGDSKDYSSSEVRKKIQHLGLESEQWRKFVPGEVIDYIADEKLFVNALAD